MESLSVAVPGFVHSVESMSCVDGPGIRYVVFMQGCQMRCAFCSNPDTWRIAKGDQSRSDDIATRIGSVAAYLEGVTVTGGEPMLQARFLEDLFQRIHKLGLTTCIDTCGRGDKFRDWDAVLPHTDYVLFCIKHIDPVKYKALTGCDIEAPLRFAEELRARSIPFQLRYVLVPGHTEDEQDVHDLVEWAARQPTLVCIELLPFHELGRHKWEELGIRYKLAGVSPPTRSKLLEFKAVCDHFGVALKCAQL